MIQGLHFFFLHLEHIYHKHQHTLNIRLPILIKLTTKESESIKFINGIRYLVFLSSVDWSLNSIQKIYKETNKILSSQIKVSK